MYIATTLVLGFSAVNTGNNLLFLVVSGLLAFMAVTGLAGMLNLKGLTPELIPPTELFAGSSSAARLRLFNSKKRLASFLIQVSCCDGPGVLFPVVLPGNTVENSLPILFQRRGPAVIGSITVSSPYPVNFFTRFWTFSTSIEMVVFPRLQPVQRSAAGENRVPAGSQVQHYRGHDGELERISPYSGREPLRVIHWKHSARRDDLLIKEFGSQAAPPLIIDPAGLPGNDLEERLSAAAWLVRHWGACRPVGLRLGSRLIPPSSGPGHSHLLLKELALHGLD